MKTLPSLALAALSLFAFTLPCEAQKAGQTGQPDPGKAGGNYNGPGDTTPGTGGDPNGGGNEGPRVEDPGFGAPGGSNTGNPYAAGANPLARGGAPGQIPGASTAPPTPITPASRPRTETPNSWQLWWHYNRWAYLDNVPELTSTGSGGFYMGRGEVEDTTQLLRASRTQVQDIVQPALIKTLLQGGRPELEIYALQALAKLRTVTPDPTLGGFADVVPSFLRSGNQDVAEKAILSLGIRGEDRFANWLITILGDEPDGRLLLGRQRVGLRFRAFAAYGLGLLAERTNSPEVRVASYNALIQALWLERVEVQAACLLALGQTPMPIADEYVDGNELFNGRTRVDQVLELLKFFDDPEQSFVARSQAPSAIARLLVDAPESLRNQAIYAFLVATNQHSKESREVQNAAAIALGELGRSGGNAIDDEVLAQLGRVAYKPSADRSTRFLAMTALAKAARRRGIGDEPYGAVAGTRKLFLQNLGRSRGETQAWTALALGILEETAPQRGEIASPDSGHALRKIFGRSRSPEVAGAIAIALGMIRDLEAEELLRERMIDTGTEHVRGYTALALGMIGSPSSVADIERVLTQSTQRPFVVENAAIAMALLGDQAIGTKLFDILSSSSRPKVQASVASAMGWIKDPRPIDDLCEQILDPRKNQTGRAWTAVAIGRICDEDAWPWSSRLSTNALYDVFLPTLIEPQLQNGLLDLP